MESTLAIAWKELQARIGSYLGWGRGALYGDLAWTAQQQFELDGITASGIRQFNNPPVLEGEAGSYDWSFLKPTATLVLDISASTIDLPDDFGGMEGALTLLSSQSQQWFPIDLVNEGKIRQAFSEVPQATGRPIWAAVVPLKGTGTTQGQRFQLFVYPAADQQYTLQVRYYILADFINGASPYPYGGASHAETLLESCLSIAESRLDDSLTVHKALFMERLAASVSADRRFKPQTLGYNGDSSESRRLLMNRGRSWARPAYNGVVYD